jgi:lysophospholipase L1-like esterase
MTKRTIKMIFLVSIPALVFALAVAEIAFRIWWGDQPTGGGGAANKVWSDKYVKINRLGLRGYVPPFEKPAGTFRIVALGDSITFGKGINREQDRFPELLASLASKRLGVKVEAINLGYLALNTVEEREMLQKTGMKFHPDVVVLGYCPNDPETFMQRLEITGRSRGPWFIQILSNQFYIADFAYKLYTSSRNMKRWREYLHYINSKNAPNMPEFKRALRGIRDDSWSNNIDLAVVIFPILDSLDMKPYEYQDADDMITAELDALGVPYANLLPLLLGHNAKEFWVSSNDVHPNEVVHEMAAKELLKLVEPMISSRIKRTNP